MSRRFLAAAVQMSSSEDREANLRAALSRIEQAARAGARLVVLPEMFACLGRPAQMLKSAEDIPGAISEVLCQAALRLGITLVAGSFCERSNDPSRACNTSLLIDERGEVLSRYRKRNLFDLQLPDQVHCQESSWLMAGESSCVTDTNCGRIGQAICFDLRFADVFVEMAHAGVEVVCVPSAFTAFTGQDHWEVLLRARAIETQSYVIAPNQCASHTPQFTTYGHSLIVDPWGRVLAVVEEAQGLAIAEIDLDQVTRVRRQLPMTRARRE